MKIELNLVTDLDEDGEPIMVDLETAVTTAVTDRISQKIQTNVAKEVQVAVAKAVESRADEWIKEALAKPLQKTDGYGHPKGTPISFAEHATKIVQDYLTKKVNPHGEESYSGTARLDSLVKEQAEVIMKEHVASALKEHRERLANLFADVLIESAAKLSPKLK